MFGWWVYTHTVYVKYIFIHIICWDSNTEVSVYCLICVCLSVVYSGCFYESQWRNCRHQPYMWSRLCCYLAVCFVVFAVVDITFVVFGGWEIKPQKSRHHTTNHLQNLLKLVLKRPYVKVTCLSKTISTKITQPFGNVKKEWEHPKHRG